MASTQVLAGFHAVVARLRHAPSSIKEIYVEATRRDKRMASLVEQAGRAGCKVHPVPPERLDGLAHGTRHQGSWRWRSRRSWRSMSTTYWT